MTRGTVCTLSFVGLLSLAALAAAQAAQPGISTGELVRQLAVGAGIVAIALLAIVEFVLRRRLARGVYYLLLFIGLLVLPAFLITGATTTMFEETKSVYSCSTCHVMEPFVADMQNAASASLAARHYHNRWIETSQCYACHTTYGAHGTFEGKRDGFRHWLLYVTGTYQEPIRYAGSYPNLNCFACHQGTPAYDRVPSHAALGDELASDRIACTECHGPPHPTPLERTATGPTGTSTGHSHAGLGLEGVLDGATAYVLGDGDAERRAR